MRLSFANERVLAVLAHPDDELLCGGTLARARQDGAAVGVCVLCRGDKGQPDPPRPDLAQVRTSEMQAAAALLGAELYLAGFGDGELIDTFESRRALTEIYRQFRPTLVLAHWERDYHADHRAASALAEAVSWFSASRGQSTASAALDSAPALWWMDTVDMLDFQPHFYVDISQHLELKQRVIRAHESQVARGGGSDFSPLEEMLLRQARARGAQAGTAAAEAFRVHRAWKRLRAW